MAPLLRDQEFSFNAAEPFAYVVTAVLLTCVAVTAMLIPLGGRRWSIRWLRCAKNERERLPIADFRLSISGFGYEREEIENEQSAIANRKSQI